MSTSPPKNARPKRPSKERVGRDVGAESFAERFRGLREKHALTRKDLAQMMGWSESRIVNYEMGTTEPTISDLVALSKTFCVDPAWLAFGTSYGAGPVAVDMDTAWLPMHGGGQMPVPHSILEGVLGPFLCVRVQQPTPGMSRGDILITKPGVRPVPGQACVIHDAGDNARIAWVVKSTAKTVSVRLGIGEPVQVIPMSGVLGVLVVSMRRSSMG